MRTSDENQSLGDDGNLQVDDHVELGVIRALLAWELQGDAEGVLEEVGLHDDDNKGDARNDGVSSGCRKETEEFTYVERVR